jgi:hypothetical protein
MEEMLIEKVRQQTFLYDTKSPDYYYYYYLYPMPLHALMDFVVFSPGHGSSVTDF